MAERPDLDRIVEELHGCPKHQHAIFSRQIFDAHGADILDRASIFRLPIAALWLPTAAS